MKFAHLIWSNLKRRKLRSGLTLLSILVAFVLFGYLSAIGRGLDQGVSVEGANVSLCGIACPSRSPYLKVINNVSAAFLGLPW